MKKMKFNVILFLALSFCSIAFGAGGGDKSSSSKSGGYAGETETTKLLRMGYPMSLKCQIAHDADVPLNLKWSKDGDAIRTDDDHYQIFSENATLLITKAGRSDVGLYHCQTKDVSPAKTANISVVFLTFKTMSKSMTVLQGDKFSLTCDAEGDPAPVITWYKDGENIKDSANVSRYSFDVNEKGTEEAMLSVSQSVYEDRAEYTCAITIMDIHYNTTIFVRVKDMYAALWPFLGICLEVFVLCLIIFIYEKRRAKNDFEESDTDQPSDPQKGSEGNQGSLRCRK